MEPIDWTKPIELMNGEPLRYDCSNKYGIWIQGTSTVGSFSTDLQGCIGGVQVVRNRKEPVKHVRYVRWNEPDRVMESYPAPQAPIGELNKLAKIILWRDETGKTWAEVPEEDSCK